MPRNNARHVIHHVFDPHFLTWMTSYDVVNVMYYNLLGPAVGGPGGGGPRRDARGGGGGAPTIPRAR